MKMKNKVLCCILHTEKQPERYEAVEKTWGARIDHMYYSDHDDPDKNIVKVSHKRDYLSCVDKNARVFNVLLKDDRYKHYDYYFFVDNDTYVNEIMLTSSINEGRFDKDKIHGHIIDRSDKGSWMTVHGGAGYLMHRSIVERFRNCPIYQDCKHSDLNICLYAQDIGVERVHHCIFNHCSGVEKHAIKNGLTWEQQLKRWRSNTAKDYATFHEVKNPSRAEFVQDLFSDCYKNTENRPKILCCILHTEKQPEQWEAIEKTWGSRIDHMYYSDHEDISKNIVKVSDSSDHRSCVEKNARVFKILINDKGYKHYDWYFFVDNDTYVNVKKLSSEIMCGEFNEDKIYGHTWKDEEENSWLMGGAGYLMHKKTLKIFEDCTILPDAKYSDINVQDYADRNGVIIEKRKGFNPCTTKPRYELGDPIDIQLKKLPEPYHKQFTLHYMKGIDLMMHVHNVIQKEYK